MPRCSIIVPVHNRASLTRQCLNTLLPRPAQAADSEIIVVDDGSTDLTPRLLAGYGDQVRVIRHEAATSFARACNDGAAVASGDYLVFLNNDTIPQAGWLDALVAYAERHPRAAIVGSKLLFPNDTIQHAGVVIERERWPRHIYAGFPADHPAANTSRQYQAVTAACALVRRSAFERAGGFDTAFTNGFEDVDLCLRLRERGHEIHYCHESVLYHLESSTTRSRPVWQDEFPKNQSLYRERWSSRVRPDDLDYYFQDGLIQLTYTSLLYPMRLEVSPLLARLDDDQRERQAEQILNRRAAQVYDLLRENTRLTAALGEAELRAQATDNGTTDLIHLPAPTPAPPVPARPTPLNRETIAQLYLHGHGIEIGALHYPLPVPATASVRYVDRMSVADLRRHYPELADQPLVEVDIIDDGERLSTVADASQDFVIANHFLEHCQDPIGALATMLRVLTVGGVVYLAVPDKRYTFDCHRPVTPLAHLLRDHADGPGWSRADHFAEWVRLVNQVRDETAASQQTAQLMAEDYSIHFHVWTQGEFLELLAAVKREILTDFDVELFLKHGHEMIFILRKTA
jgi:GT2 family glycosyltransferase/predicted SAM-dependent methyltransferase